MEKASWPNTVFGTMLKQLRKASDITQEELAFRVGLARNYISLLERGVKSPTLTVFLRLCVALKQQPEKIMAEVYRRVVEEEAEGRGTLFPDEISETSDE
jgi:transcriptional regulator with XRE-family HTH domain